MALARAVTHRFASAHKVKKLEQGCFYVALRNVQGLSYSAVQALKVILLGIFVITITNQ